MFIYLELYLRISICLSIVDIVILDNLVETIHLLLMDVHVFTLVSIVIVDETSN